jgi:hypothetical protein
MTHYEEVWGVQRPIEQEPEPEMAVWDPIEDDYGDHGANVIVALIIGIALSCPMWMALIAGVRFLVHHAK